MVKLASVAMPEFSQEQEILRLKQALAESEAERSCLYDFFMQVPTPLCILHGRELRYILANPSYENFCGRKVVGKTLLEIFSEEEVGQFVPLIQNVYETGIPYTAKEVPLHLLDAQKKPSEQWIDIGYYPFRENGAGEISGVLAFVYNVTDQVQARKAVEKSTALLNAISKTSLDFIFAKDINGRMVFANPAIYKTLGKTEAEVIGHTDIEFLGEKIGGELMATDRRIMDYGENLQVEEVLPGVTGPRTFITNKFPYRNSENKVVGLLGISHDVTELRDMQKNLQATVARLENERKLRENFVATLTHDLRSPMTAAKMTAQLIARKSDPEDLTYQQATKIAACIDRSDQMIQNLLDSSRIQSGEKLALQMKSFSLDQAIADVLSDLKIIHGDRFVFSNAAEPLVGYWNADSLKRVVENLCTNAVKYGNDKAITIRLEKCGAQVFLAVHNEGNPLTKEEQCNIFRPFKRTNAAECGGQRGWGLGLTVVRGVIEAHGGTVQVESAPEQGTTFSVILPLDSRAFGSA